MDNGKSLWIDVRGDQFHGQCGVLVGQVEQWHEPVTPYRQKGQNERGRQGRIGVGQHDLPKDANDAFPVYFRRFFSLGRKGEEELAEEKLRYTPFIVLLQG